MSHRNSWVGPFASLLGKPKYAMPAELGIPTQKGPGYRTRRSARCGNAKVGVIIPSSLPTFPSLAKLGRGEVLRHPARNLGLPSKRLRLKPVAFSPVPLHRPYGTNAKPERTTMLLFFPPRGGDSAIKNACQEPLLNSLAFLIAK